MIAASYLRNVYLDEAKGHLTLAQSKITETVFFDSWPEFVADFIQNVTYPAPASHKFESYGWTPTIFAEGLNKYGKHGHWRRAANGGDELTLFIADMDNQFGEREMIDIDTLEAFLRHLGLPFVLYTSFSHKAERHKVRIVTPVSRLLTPDEAFAVFTWFNHALDYQLDGSIYDQGDYLYGPPHGADVRTELSGQPLDVDRYLTLADGLSQAAKDFVPRKDRQEARDPTPEEIAHAKALMAVTDASEGVSINNPATFNPAWIKLLDDRYCEGSRHQTVLGLLTKAWIKSKRTLTFGDLQTLQNQMDALLGGYLVRQYGRAILNDDIKSVMRVVPAQTIEPEYSTAEQREQQIAKEIARLQRRRAAD